MAIHQLAINKLFERNRQRLELSWVGGTLDRIVSVRRSDLSPADLVGHLNLIHPDRIQVLGTREITWLAGQPIVKTRQDLAQLQEAHPPALIIADGCELPEIVLASCSECDTPIFSTPRTAASVIDALRLYVSRYLAESVMMHGVFMDVLGIGVLMTGDSGVGKSELALELISRGHGLVADDVVEILRVAPETLEGKCPSMLKDFLEVRGLGLLNIRTIFGETACRRKMPMRLIVHLQRPVAGAIDTARLPLDAQNEIVLGLPIRKVVIPVAAGRNLAVLLEAAVRAAILHLRGIDSMQEFLDRQKQAIDDDMEPG